MNELSNLINRRPAMTLLSGPTCILSHCCRIVLLDKGVECSIDYVPAGSDPSIVGEHNPYGETPTLLDRDLVLYDTSVILEYLDERFPHPPLMPVDPISRAKTRLMISRITRDWLQPLCQLSESQSINLSGNLKKDIHDGLVALSPLFKEQPFFLGHEYTLVDAYLAPLIWRLPALGIELPRQAESMVDYSKRLFERTTFQESLSEAEVEIRQT